jgi:hypothetical protein
MSFVFDEMAARMERAEARLDVATALLRECFDRLEEVGTSTWSAVEEFLAEADGAEIR